jgi:hypothetical protein
MDESGTHNDSHIVTVAAYAARPKAWASFTREWNAKKIPVQVYHANDVQNQWGEFTNWTAEECTEFAKKMLPIIPKHIPIGILIGVDQIALNEALDNEPTLKEMIGSPYACCFQWVVQTLINKLEDYGSNQQLAFFHEQNDYQREAHEAFEWVRQHRKSHSAKMALAFGSKQQYVPLQAADILAYEGNKRLRGVDEKRPKRKALWAIDPDEDRLIIKRYSRKNIPWLIERLKIAQEEIRIFGQPVGPLGEQFS